MSGTQKRASQDIKELRRTLGAFATGVTVVTTLDGDGERMPFDTFHMRSMRVDCLSSAIPALRCTCRGEPLSSSATITC